MSEMNICFDSAVYQRALEHLKSTGLVTDKESFGMLDLDKYPKDAQYGCVTGKGLVKEKGPSVTLCLEKCVSTVSVTEKNPIIVDLKKSPKGFLQKEYNYGYSSNPDLYVSEEGKAYYVVDGGVMGFDRGVEAVLGMDVKTKDAADQAAIDGLRILYQCEAKSDAECTQKAVASLKIKAGQAKQVAINQYVNEGNKYVNRAKKIIELSKQQDKGLGGITPSDLIDIFSNHGSSDPYCLIKGFRNYLNPTTVSDASSYAFHAKEMLGSIVLDYSGYKTIKERPDSGCTVSEYDTAAPSSCPSGQVSYGGEDRTVSCSDIGFSVTGTISERGCTYPAHKPIDTGR